MKEILNEIDRLFYLYSINIFTKLIASKIQLTLPGDHQLVYARLKANENSIENILGSRKKKFDKQFQNIINQITGKFYTFSSTEENYQSHIRLLIKKINDRFAKVNNHLYDAVQESYQSYHEISFLKNSDLSIEVNLNPQDLGSYEIYSKRNIPETEKLSIKRIDLKDNKKHKFQDGICKHCGISEINKSTFDCD